ncbi:MAG: NADP-dependent oxidoreductase [Proteobacteria bacterium]|nr:NADP-dependent oxidoreductase [Pseudomonadota bacterium]
MDNRQILIDSLPQGELRESNYTLATTKAPQPENGQVLCRTLAIAIEAGSRAGLQGSASYAGAPKSGIVMNGHAAARVVASYDPAYKEGDLVTCPAGWQDYSVHEARALTRIEGSGDPARYLSALGNSGLTAYFGLFNVGQPQAGETLLVSAAAGAVGHFVGQMGRIAGMKTVGVAGSDEKCARLVSELKFNGAINYKDGGFRANLKEVTPDGVDLYFDNTGGDVLGSALFRMNENGRIVCCGVVSQYDTSNPAPGPKGVPGLLVNKRLRMQGFLVFDHIKQYSQARSEIAGWLDSGELIAWQDEFDGLESAPRALVDLLAGGNTGKRIVRVAE